jgi:glutaredoxin-related protein
MIFKEFKKYNFNNSEVRGIMTSINFSRENDVEIVLHEETSGRYEQVRDIEIVKAFPPLVFATDVDLDFLNFQESIKQIKKLTLLDGHHRFEHLTLYNYDYSIPIVLVSNKDVKVQSYNSKINGDKQSFIEFLISNNFKPSSSKYFIDIEDCQYSNTEVNNIYELYDFKRKLLKSDLITPTPNDRGDIEDLILNFTPVQLIEFHKENYLFHPKSTWISPRI